MRKWQLFLLVIAAAVAGGLTIPRLLTWFAPAMIHVEGGGRVAAGLPFNVQVRANKPVELAVTYFGQALGEQGRELQLPLVAEDGAGTVRVRAVDSRGQESNAELPVQGVPALEPRVSLPTELYAGDPVGVQVSWDQAAPVQLDEIRISVGAEEVPHIRTEQGLFAIGRIPLTVEPGSWQLGVSLIDEFGRDSGRQEELLIREWPTGIETLSLPQEILGVMTAENREREAAVLAEAYSRAEKEPLWSEPFLLPGEGWHSSPFGSPRRYEEGGSVSHHLGEDLASGFGTPIRATNDGIVLIAGWYPLKGGLVVLDHGAGVSSLYMHQSEILVTPGQRVSRGDVLGEVGSTGISTGPHLHWEMHVRGEPVNPMLWVDRLVPAGYGGGD